MSNTGYRAAIVGLGFIGAGDQVSGDALGQQVTNLDGTHAEALGRNPRVKLVAGSSRDGGRRERFAARTGAKTYADWREMLERERPEIVSVATYAPQHAEVTVAAAGLGARAVYCEKPIATCVADARRMLDACAAAGALLVINHNRRFNPNYRRLRGLVASGELGELTSASLQWPTGRLGNVGTHMIDALQMLAGRAVVAVSGTLDPAGRPDCRGAEFRDPGGWGVLRLEGGVMVTLDAGDRSKLPPRIALHGTTARAAAGGDEVSIDYADGRTERWPSARGEATSMDRAVGEIVAQLDGAARLEYQVEEAVRTLEAIVAFHVSHEREAAWVKLPLDEKEHRREVHSG